MFPSLTIMIYFCLAAWFTFLSKHLLCHKQLQNSWDHISSVVTLCWFCFEDSKSENLVVFDTITCIRILVWLGWTNYSFLITLLTYGWSCLNTISDRLNSTESCGTFSSFTFSFFFLFFFSLRVNSNLTWV